MDTLFDAGPAVRVPGSPFRVIVTGSRTWDVPRIVENALSAACADALAARCGQLVVVHGAAPAGADRFAATWARRVRTGMHEDSLRVRAEPHAADWQRYGPRVAGFIRNEEMVVLGADLCLAFVRPCFAVKCSGRPGHDSHGTADCMARAGRAGIAVRRFES